VSTLLQAKDGTLRQWLARPDTPAGLLLATPQRRRELVQLARISGFWASLA